MAPKAEKKPAEKKPAELQLPLRLHHHHLPLHALNPNPNPNHHNHTLMDILFAQIQADLRSNDALRQSGALLQALQQSAAGRDISVLAKSAVEEIVASPASAVSKKLAFDLIRSTRLTTGKSA